ncbi:MAG: hypothetical protein AB8G05_01710 [Oligoflexales bacterium]
MSPDQHLIEQMASHVPIVIWSRSNGIKKQGNLDAIAISILHELDKFSYIETSIRTIACAFDTSDDHIRSIISSLFCSGYFKKITIYQQGKASLVMFDKNDNHPKYTPTELRVLQKATPIWEKK